MFLKLLRQDKGYSQERLAEISGLSLRTIQRVEAGHRVGYPSMRVLAATFEIDVDELERELYAMNTNNNEYRELPLSVRLMMGKGWYCARRQQNLNFERFCLLVGGSFFLLWVSSLYWSVNNHPGILAIAIVMALCGWYTSYVIRVGDKYAAWPEGENPAPEITE